MGIRRAGRIMGFAGAALLGVGLLMSVRFPDVRTGLATLGQVASGQDGQDPAGAAQTLAPAFDVRIPADYQWAEDQTRELHDRCWRALQRLYGVTPPYAWQVSYEPEIGAVRYDLPALPVYEGQGRLRMSVDYLAAPPGDDRWAQADTLGTLEGLAYAFHEYLGLDRTDLSAGLAAVTARDLGPTLWGGLRAGDINALTLVFEEREANTVRYWREHGWPPKGMEPVTWERQRGIACWRAVGSGLSSATWRRFFAELNASGEPLTQAADRHQGNRLVAGALRRATGRDYGKILRDYGYEL